MLTAKLTLERFDKNHRLLEKRVQPSRSFLIQFIEGLYVQHAQILAAGPYAMDDITNTSRNVDAQGQNSWHYAKNNLCMGAPGGDSDFFLATGYTQAPVNSAIEGYNIGIVVGTGNNPVAPGDYALQTQVAQGRAAGQLEYGGCEWVNMAFADPNGTVDLRRYFTNLSGGGITIEEVGIYGSGTLYASAGLGGRAWPFAFARDLTGGVAVADTELLRVTYTIQITV
jgi:hypothetical protein